MPAAAPSILCITSSFPRWVGDSTTPFVLNLAQDLQTLGWEILVLAPHAPGAARAEVLDGVRVERFRYFWPEQQQSVCYQGGALINLRHNPLNKLKLPALVTSELGAVIRRLANRARPQLLHSHWILPQGFVGALARSIIPGPHVITVHGGDVFALRGALMRQAKGFALRHADTITVNSSVTEAAVRELPSAAVPIHRIPMGVSIQGLSAEQRQRAAEIRQGACGAQGQLVAFVGRLVEEKGVADLLHALAALRATHPNLRALIIGDGQDKTALESLARGLTLTDRVRFTGWVPAKQLPPYLIAADLLVAPSRRVASGWIEAQGLSLLEAMALGTPVIATRLGGVVDAIAHETTGLLVPERQPKALARAISRLLTEPALRERLARKARELAVARFSRSASAAAFDQLFSSLIASGRARRQ